MTDSVQKIVIVGGGLSGWMTAAVLSRAFAEHRRDIVVVDSDNVAPDLLDLDNAISATPPLRTFLAILGLEEDPLMSRTQAVFKLGAEFRDWGRKGDAYFHPYGLIGSAMDGVPFHQFFAKLKSLGDPVNLDDYSLAATAAARHKFVRPSSDPTSVLSTHGYAMNFDAGLLARMLRAFAEHNRARRIEGALGSVEMRDDGYIQAIVLADGVRLEGDLFVDCTGADARLIGEAMGVGFEDWSHWLPCDRAVAYSTALTQDLPSATRAIARDAGWQWRIPLQDRISHGYVYCSKHVSDADALAYLRANVGTPPVTTPQATKFTSGVRKQLWVKNCVAIGHSGRVLDPVESMSLQLLQTAASKLVVLFPAQTWSQADRDEYNRLMHTEMERMRDFVVAHYIVGAREDTPFWKQCRAITPPPSLAYRLRGFESRGYLLELDEELFLTPSWVSVLIGQGMRSRRYDPLVDQVEEANVRATLQRMQNVIRHHAEAMPTHAAFVEKTCRAPRRANGTA